jgi:CubicO group peptidase (beta-lactamase class C family)
MSHRIFRVVVFTITIAALFSPCSEAQELPAAYAAYDIDGDGALGPQEVGPVLRRDFARLDGDGDGTLSAGELMQPVMVELSKRRATKVPVTEPKISGEVPSFTDVTAYLEETFELGQLAGIAVRVQHGGDLLYEKSLGDLGPETVVPVASASKWVTAALLMTLVDDGLLSLDGPLSAHLPFLVGMPAEPVTLRQALAHTGGFGSEHFINQPFEMDMMASAKALAATERPNEPGSTFQYTGVAMQLAAAAAEAVTAKTWSELFEERIAGPLGMSDTAYGHPMRDIDFEQNVNQSAEGGVHATLRDYSRFLEMLAGRGVFRGTRILSEKSIAEMETNHTHDLDVGFMPPGAREGWGYGLGLWCEHATPELECVRVNSAGAYGAFPWLDRERGIQGVVLVVESISSTIARTLAIRDLVDRVVDGRQATPEEPPR